MVTTFKPPMKPKPKKKLPILPIALGVIAAVLLVLVVKMQSKLGTETTRNAQLTATAVKVAETVGSTNITPEILADTTAVQAALDGLAADVGAQSTALQTTRTDLEAAQAESTRLQGELTAATTAASDAEAKASSSVRDLTARTAELAALQSKYDKDVADLKSQIEDLKKVEVAAASAEVAAEEQVGESAEASSGAEAAAPEPVAADAKTNKIKDGDSRHFKSYTYDPGKSSLTFNTLGGKKITFSDVPAVEFDKIAAAPVLDVYFRFRIMDVYPSQPKADEFMRDLND